MPAAMNLQPRKRGAVAGMLRHDFRQYEPDHMPAHVDPERQHRNRVLYGSENALDNLPERQPDTGRKIRKDANVAASFVLTLPKELSEHDVDAWTTVTMNWLHHQCPGEVAYAVLHRDESRSHIHAAVIPQDDRGHLSYKVYFNGRGKLRRLQASYARALEPLGVQRNSEAVKALRRTQYTRGIHGWRVPNIVHELEAREQALSRDLAMTASQDTALGHFLLPTKADVRNPRRYQERVIPQLLKIIDARVAKLVQEGQVMRRDGMETKAETQALTHQLRTIQRALQEKTQTVQQLTQQVERLRRVLTPEQQQQIQAQVQPDRDLDFGL